MTCLRSGWIIQPFSHRGSTPEEPSPGGDVKNANPVTRKGLILLKPDVLKTGRESNKATEDSL